LMACGDDGSRGRTGNAAQNGTTQNGTTQNGTTEPGDSDKSSFDVTIEGDGQSEKATNEQPNEAASQDTWGATIADGQLFITLLSETGTALSVIVETTEALMAPGSFPVSAPPEGTQVTLLDPVAGTAFASETTGSIRLDSCPKAVGEKAVGAFENVVLEDDFSEATRTLSGTFDVLVYHKSGDLNCKPPASTNNTNPDPANNPPGGTCDDFEYCDGGGVCCPYAECMGSCNFACVFQDPACASGDVEACAVCFEGCFDECNVSQACRGALVTLDACGETHSCDAHEDEDDEEACMLDNCCDEAKAAW
ncbi:MAG: hypothetical protein ACNA8W_10855, partial [Bradymonadaceae bacterium]